uniref:Integrin, alpha 3b n=1 Tax=Erpetoichthys calabaricus TaxID=27687 RepID=A0A8C4SYM2_ERPCA
MFHFKTGFSAQAVDESFTHISLTLFVSFRLLTGAPKEKATSNINANANETGALYYCPITNDMTDCMSPSTEMIEGMWLGVTVASQGGPTGGRVLACGHRYVRIMMSGNEEQLRMIGKCFVRGNSLNYDEDDDWQIHHYEVCNPGGDLNMEGMCSMGMAAGMTETDVYIGMPGSFNWQGGLPSFKCIPWGPLATKLSNLDKSNSYIGYSVLDEKNIFYADRYTIISGAPRDEHKGAVYLLDSQNELVSNMTLNGQQVGSYFGNSLAATDLNNDGWKDLIVGAPFYFDRKRELGGAAYIFMNEGGNFQATPTLVLNGVSESGFGFAVANIGDVNQDGFQGEYAKETKLGTSEKGRSICSSLNPVIQTFGYSVNGGLDVDENAYPDILVGSLSNKIALLRARPVIQLSKTFTVSPAIVDPDNIKDKLQPIVFALNYSIPESRPKSRRGAIQNLDAFPVLSDTQKNRDTREISFQKECGNDNKCRSNLQVTASFTTEQQVDLPRQILQYSPDVKKLYVTVNVTNYPSATKEAEDAHQAILNITLPSALQYSGVRSATILLIFEASGITLNTQEITLSGSHVQMIFCYTDLPNHSLHLDTPTLYCIYSMLAYLPCTTIFFLLSQVTMNSEPLGDKGTLQLELEWPYEIANGKWLLYLMAISTKGTAATRCVPPGEEVNPLNLTLSKLPSRSKREAEGPASCRLTGIFCVFGSDQDCSQHTANCIRVHCPLVNMTQEAKVTVRSRVWNSTLLELSLNIDSEIAEEKPYEIELWIIIVAVLAGVLLLGLIILLLWKCGFFKRASRRAMYEAKGQKAEMKIQPSETERLTEDY